jgi:hypothetical protein
MIRFFSENPLLGRVMFWMSVDDFHIDERLGAAHERVTCIMRKLIIRGQEIGTVRKDLPLETIERLMHAIGKVLSADIIGERILQPDANTLPRDGEVWSRVEKFMNMAHDLGKRILTPGEVQHV